MGAPRISWRHLAAIAAFALLLSTGTAGQRAAGPPSPRPPTAPAQIVVKLRDGADPALLQATDGVRGVAALLPHAVATGRRSAARHAARDARGPDGAAADVAALEAGFARTFVVRVEPGAIDATLARHRQHPGVEYAERDGVIAAQWTPDDPYFASSGSWGQPHADLYGLHVIRAPQAWDLTRGAGVVVAIADTGIDWTHADIDGNVWVNAGEIAGNGIDDDGNGYVDDVRGWDFNDGDADPFDRHGHGTHVAGIVAAEGDNADGIVGVAPSARVMAVQVMNDGASGLYTVGAQGILYAVMNGADVVNASWGGSSPSTLLEEAVRYARDRGVLVVTSAGNAGLDAADFMPASIPEAVTVAASSHLDRVPAFSNHGSSVDVTAPGAGILSLRAFGVDPHGGGTHVVGGRYYWADGSSMAAAYVSGGVALLLSHLPTEKVEVTRDRLAFTADPIEIGHDALIGGVGGGRLNLWRALTASLAPPSLSIGGQVVDRQGLPIGGATVALGAMGSHRVVTGADGRYHFRALRPGGRYVARTWRLGVDFLPGRTSYAELATSPATETIIGVRRWAHDPVDTTWAAGSAALSLGLDAAGEPRVAYRLPFENQLRYAARTPQGWAVEVVESAAASGALAVGNACSLAIDASGRPHIVYGRFASDGTPGLRYAVRDSTGWTIDDVPASPPGWQSRFVLDLAGLPHIVEAQPNTAGSLVHRWKDAGGWHDEQIVDAEYLALSDVALDPQGRVHIAYQSNGGSQQMGAGFWHAVREPWGWRHTLAHVMPFAGNPASLDFSGALPRLAYRYTEPYGVNPSLRHGAWDGTAWTSAVVHPGLLPAAVSLVEGIAGGSLIAYDSPVGLMSALGLWGGWARRLVHRGLTGAYHDMARDPGGRAHLTYTDWHTGFLWHARSLSWQEPAWSPPIVAITTPAPGRTVGGVVPIRATAQGPLGIHHVDLLIDGVLVTRLGAAPYAFVWDTRMAPDGVHQLMARVTDATGATATHAIAVTVVNAAPP
jgi:subtilisin family serine protease